MYSQRLPNNEGTPYSTILASFFLIKQLLQSLRRIPVGNNVIFIRKYPHPSQLLFKLSER